MTASASIQIYTGRRRRVTAGVRPRFVGQRRARRAGPATKGQLKGGSEREISAGVVPAHFNEAVPPDVPPGQCCWARGQSVRARGIGERFEAAACGVAREM